MASETMLSFLAAVEMLKGIDTYMDSGSLGGVIEIWEGTVPADVETAAAGTLLATLTMQTPNPWDTGTPVNNNPGAEIQLSAQPSSDTSAIAGTAQYFVAGLSNVSDTIATRIIQGSCGLAGANPDMVLDDDAISTNGTVAITAWNLKMAES
jgi:hypothetical protein